MGTVLRVGTFIDGTGRPPLTGAEILIENGKIVSVGAIGALSTADHTVHDHSSQTLIPGLIDLHTHFLYLTDHEFQKSEMRPNRAVMVTNGIRNTRAWLDQGVTTARSVGTPFDLDFDLKELLAKRPEMGPRLVAAGRMMTMTGGKRTPWDFMKDEVSGPDEARRWTRNHIKEGADLVKLYCTTLLEEDVATYLTDVLALPDGAPDPGRWSSLSVEEISAVSDEAHKAGCTVAAHVAPAFGIKLALRGQVDTIEHGSELDDECIDLFLETGATLVPTLSITWFQQARAQELKLPGVYAEFAQRRWEQIKERVKRAHRAGVPIGTGTDAILEGMDYLTEVELMVECGLTPLEAIHAATARGAAAMRTAGRHIGTLEAGKWADMVLLNDDPTTNIHNIRSTAAVFKAGVRVDTLS